MSSEVSIRFEGALTTDVEYIAVTQDDENSSSLSSTMTSQSDKQTTTECANSYCVSNDEYIDMIREFVFPTPFEWVLIGLYVVVFVVGMVGNFLVCFVVWVDRSMRTVTNLFIVNLSVADFLVLFVCLPTTVLGDVTETWYMGGVMCKIVQYLQGVSVSVSVLTLSVISVERFYAICHPLQFRATARRAKLIICFIWIASLLILLPDVIVLDTHRYFPPELTLLLTSCKPTWDYHHQVAYQLFLTLALFVLPLMLMAVAYVRIAVCLWSTVIPSEATGQRGSRTSVRRHPCMQSPSLASIGEGGGSGGAGRGAGGEVGGVPRSSSSSVDRHSQVLARRKVAKMLIAVVLMFAVCYLPVHLLNILRYIKVGLTDRGAPRMALIAHWLCYFNSAINPVIYNFMSEKFQKAFRIVLLCSMRRGRGSHQTTRLILWNNASRNTSNATTRIHRMTTFV